MKFLLAITWAAFVVISPAAQTTEEPAKILAGTVVDEQGRPVSDAAVDCYQYSSQAGFGYLNRQPELQQSAVTDNQGTFAVSASFVDTTLVVVKKAGMALAWKTWNATKPDSADPIILTVPAALTGVVVDDSGKPVADAEVWVAGANLGDKYGNDSPMNELFGRPARACFSAKTSADGRFRIENFPAAGRAGLAVTKAGMARHTVGNELGGERDCQPGQDLKLVVGLAGSVEGKVMVAETGQPLGGVQIKMDQFGAGVFGSDYYEAVETRADGTFRVADVQPGKHCIRASISGGPIPDWVFVPEESQLFTVTAGETVSNVVIHFSKGALVEVTVVVTNTLQPLANVTVFSGEDSAHTDDNGVAFVRSLTGTNRIFATKEDWSPQHAKAVIEAGSTNKVQVNLIPPPRITGTVSDSSGKPVAGTRVSFHPGQYPSAPKYVETQTDSAGRYELTMKEDSRRFGFWSGPISPTNFVMAQSLNHNLAAMVEFDALPTNLDLTLQPGITLSGSVKETEGSPVTNATVDISILSDHSIARLWPQPVKVDAQGSFTLAALPQGREYELWQGISAKGYGTTYGRLKAEDSKTNHYEFPAFVLKRADRQVAGQILGRDGKPVVGARVSISGQGQLNFREAKSDGQGHFKFDGVCAGEVKVDARYYTSPDYSNSEQGDISAQGGDTNVVVRLGINSYVYPNSAGRTLRPFIKTTGVVGDSAGTALAGVKVLLFAVAGRPLESVTDGGGHYEINWQGRTGASEATIWLLARDFNTGLASLHLIGETTTNLNLTLQAGITLFTQVSDTDGQSLTNATAGITLRHGNSGRTVDSQPTRADNLGHLRIVALPQGQIYSIEIQATNHTSQRIELAASETGTNRLKLPPVVLTPTDGEASGLVLDTNGAPAAGITVQVFATGTVAQRTTTDSNGRFEYHGISRGALSFEAGFPISGNSGLGNPGSARGNSGDTNIVIRLGTARNLLTESRQLTTSGTVFDPSGKPVAGAILVVLPGGWSPVRSDAGGKYTVRWQTLMIRSNNAVMFAQDAEHNLAALPHLDTNATELDIHLQPGLMLSGSVQDSQGRPVTNAFAQLVVMPPADLTRSTLNRQTPTNASVDGRYSFVSLPRGVPYLVRVSAAGYWPTDIRVSAADTNTGKIELPKAVLDLADQQVAGQVLNLDGKPCWGALVAIIEEEVPSRHTAHTDAGGHFVIQGVSKGLLNVRATLPVSATNPQFLVATKQAQGGDANVVLKLQTN